MKQGRKFLIAFLSAMIIFSTLSGLFIVAYRTKGAIMPIETPASFKISEDGKSYLLSFLGEKITLPRKYSTGISNFFKKYPSLLPAPVITVNYLSDKLSNTIFSS